MENIPAKIGVLDSGVGGLSVLREIHHLLPEHPTLYYADQAHLPYGPRSVEELRGFTDAITRFLLGRGAEIIVIACNTASAASLLDLRQRYPQVPFVGMEPAVKPAAEASKTGVIGVLATQTTASGALYQRVLERYAQQVRVITQIAPELVTIVESGDFTSPLNRLVIDRILQPFRAFEADQIVLACTHFPFLMDVMRESLGSTVTLIDPSPAIARQTARLLHARQTVSQPMPEGLFCEAPDHRYFTSGSASSLQAMLRQLIEVDATPESVVLD